MKYLIVFSMFFLVNSFASAAGTYVGTIEEVWINDPADEGVGWLKLTGLAENSACVNGKWFAINLSADESKFIITAALSAKVSQSTVTVGGDNTCRGNYENLKYIAVK